MKNEERRRIENECLLTKSKAQMINLYLDKLREIEILNKTVANLTVYNFEKDKEIERLNKENNDLRKLYQRTYKHLFDIGNDELARYFQAQIDECSTFYIEPIIDYYEEYKRLNNIINNIRKRVLDENKPLPSAKEIIDIIGVDKE